VSGATSRPIQDCYGRRDPGAIACKQGSYALRAESKAPRPTPLCFCPKGVGVRLADDGARNGPDTRRPGSSGIPRVQGLPPLRGRSLASQTPAACGQSQKPREQVRSYKGADGSMICCLCRSQLVGEGFDAVRQEQRVARFRTAVVGRDPGTSPASKAPTPSGQNQKRHVQHRTKDLRAELKPRPYSFQIPPPRLIPDILGHLFDLQIVIQPPLPQLATNAAVLHAAPWGFDEGGL